MHMLLSAAHLQPKYCAAYPVFERFASTHGPEEAAGGGSPSAAGGGSTSEADISGAADAAAASHPLALAPIAFADVREVRGRATEGVAHRSNALDRRRGPLA